MRVRSRSLGVIDWYILPKSSEVYDAGRIPYLHAITLRCTTNIRNSGSSSIGSM